MSSREESRLHHERVRSVVWPVQLQVQVTGEPWPMSGVWRVASGEWDGSRTAPAASASGECLPSPLITLVSTVYSLQRQSTVYYRLQSTTDYSLQSTTDYRDSRQPRPRPACELLVASWSWPGDGEWRLESGNRWRASGRRVATGCCWTVQLCSRAMSHPPVPSP